MPNRQVFPKPSPPRRSQSAARRPLPTIRQMVAEYDKPFDPAAPVVRPRNHVYVNNPSKAGITDRETLSQIIDMELESMDVPPSKAREISIPGESVVDAAYAYESAVDAVLRDYIAKNYRRFNLGSGPLDRAQDEGDVLDVLSELGGGASYLYFMQAEGHGIGTWDGRWDEVFRNTNDINRLSKLVEKNTKTEYQALKTAIENRTFDLMQEHGLSFEENPRRARKPSRTKTDDQYYAQPYNPGAVGFYFSTEAEFEEGMKKLKRKGIEEFELQFINGDDADADLFNQLKINQMQVGLWFNELQPLSEHEKAGIYGLHVSGYSDIEEMIEKVKDDNPVIFEGTALEYAREYVDDVGVENMGESKHRYFDYEMFGQAIKNDILTSSDDEEEMERVEGMSDSEVGEEWVDSMGWDSVGKQNLEEYFDYEYFARDLQLGGDINEMKFAGKTWVYDNNR